jgi:ribosome-associated protein
MPIEITPRLSIPDDDVVVVFARSGGSGGQNVNKVSSKVQLRFFLEQSTVLRDDVKARMRAAYPGRLTDDGAFLVVSEKTRDQKKNLDDACEKLAALIRAVLIAPKPRTKTKPTKGSVRRRLGDKKSQGEKKRGRGRVEEND